MGNLALWPSMTDSDGTPGNGTAVDKALMDLIKAAILDEVYDAGNPTVKVQSLIQEIINARGSLGTLDGRLSVSLNADGTLKSVGGLVSSSVLAGALATSLVADGTFLIWPSGDSAAPAYCSLDAGSVARVTATPSPKIGAANSVKVLSTGTVTHTLIPAADIANFGFMGNVVVGFGCWLYADTADIGKLTLDDGTQTVDATDAISGASAIHVTGSWRWFSGTMTISPSATKLQLKMRTINPGNVYYSGLTATIGSVAPTGYVPCPSIYATMAFRYGITLPTGITWAGAHTKVGSAPMSRPGIIKDVQCHMDTVPTTTDVLVDIKVPDGAGTDVSIFNSSATAPKVAATKKNGSARPDGTYQRRCLQGLFDNPTNSPAGSRIYADIGQTDATSPGADLEIAVRILQYLRPLEPFLGYSS